jgi:hypothetical protein
MPGSLNLRIYFSVGNIVNDTASRTGQQGTQTEYAEQVPAWEALRGNP